MRTDEQKPDKRRERGTSWPHTAKSIAIKGAKRTSGGDAWKAVELTLGDLRRVREGLRGSQGTLSAAQKSAEAIVGRTKLGRPEGERRRLCRPKGRTVPERGERTGRRAPMSAGEAPEKAKARRSRRNG